jgi:hypothetical protein
MAADAGSMLVGMEMSLGPLGTQGWLGLSCGGSGSLHMSSCSSNRQGWAERRDPYAAYIMNTTCFVFLTSRDLSYAHVSKSQPVLFVFI